MKKYAMISLGCPKNLVDSEKFVGILDNANYKLCENPEDAEIVIVNTCGFIQDAKEESIQTILEIAELKKSANLKKLIVTGCLVQRYHQDIEQEIPEINYLFDLKEFHKFAEVFDAD